MDTFINIKVYSNDKALIETSFNAIDKMYSDYDKLCDRYKSYKDIINIKYINDVQPLDEEIEIDEKLYNILKYSKFFYTASDELFNIALGNVIDVWSKYRKGEKKGVPDLSELQSSGSIDLSSLVLKEPNILMKTKAISLDLGGIAKGYVTELVGQYLESVGLKKYLITAGTSSVKAGSHYNNDRYKIGLINPNDTSDIYKVVNGNNIVVTTSGSFDRFYEYEGVRYHHIINPKTLFPPNHLLSVTVITNDAMLGEILSTTLFILPIEEGLEHIKKYDNAEAVWYGVDGKITMSDGMSIYE